jgi:hypothetical protein
MRIARFLIPAVALTVAVVAAPTAALAAPKAAVAMTFSATPDPVAVGKTITLSGRAAAGKTGNAGTVEFYFRKDRSPRYTRVATTSAAANGTFSRAAKATASGTYVAVYRGNKYRKSASRADHASVFTTRTTTKTVWQYSGTDVECGPATNGCHIFSGDLEIQPGPLNVSFLAQCTQPAPSLMMGFTDDPTNTAPEPNQGPYAAPGWRWWPIGGATGGEFDLAPAITQGHFYVHALVKPAFGPAHPTTTCTMSVTATQQVTQTIPV